MPYLDPIVERLLDPLNSTEDNSKQSNKYVQEQAIAALAVVAKKSPGVFAKVSERNPLGSSPVSNVILTQQHYSSVMPLLLNILRNANRSDSGKLIAKTMECTGLISLLLLVISIMCYLRVYIAAAVGLDVFRPDATTLAELLVQIQSTPCFYSVNFCR